MIGGERPFRIYLPPCYESSDDVYPVLYLLHGYPFSDDHWDALGIDEAADQGIAQSTLPPIVIAMPAADNEGTYTKTSGGPNSFEGVMLDEFIPFVETQYRVRVDSSGRAIGGMSRGAVWSLEIAFNNPGKFAAVGGHSAAVDRNYNLAPPRFDPIHLVSASRLDGLRIYLDAGANDWALSGVNQLHQALTAEGVPHVFEVFPGIHEDAYWAAHVADYLAFYLADW